MLDYGTDGNAYRNTDKYPSKSDFTTYYFYNHGAVVAVHGYNCVDSNALFDLTGIRDSKTALQKAKSTYVSDSKVDTDYNAACDRWNTKSRELQEKWYADIYSYYGVDKDDPVIQKIISKAYEDGHAYGLQEVEGHFSTLLEFVKEIQDIMRSEPTRYGIGL